jgi:hypothetical protein
MATAVEYRGERNEAAEWRSAPRVSPPELVVSVNLSWLADRSSLEDQWTS